MPKTRGTILTGSGYERFALTSPRNGDRVHGWMMTLKAAVLSIILPRKEDRVTLGPMIGRNLGYLATIEAPSPQIAVRFAAKQISPVRAKGRGFHFPVGL